VYLHESNVFFQDSNYMMIPIITYPAQTTSPECYLYIFIVFCTMFYLRPRLTTPIRTGPPCNDSLLSTGRPHLPLLKIYSLHPVTSILASPNALLCTTCNKLCTISKLCALTGYNPSHSPSSLHTLTYTTYTVAC
jgi:hypothetical protein